MKAEIIEIHRIRNGDGEWIEGKGFVVRFDVLGQIFKNTAFIASEQRNIKNHEQELIKLLGGKIQELGLMIKKQAEFGGATNIEAAGRKLKTFGWA